MGERSDRWREGDRSYRFSAAYLEACVKAQRRTARWLFPYLLVLAWWIGREFFLDGVMPNAEWALFFHPLIVAGSWIIGVVVVAGAMETLRAPMLWIVAMIVALILPILIAPVFLVFHLHATLHLRRFQLPAGFSDFLHPKGVRESAVQAFIERRPCPRCGYSLIGNTSGVCPECGVKTPHPSWWARLDRSDS